MHHGLSSNPHIRVISEGSCDTEDWSNDAENSALIYIFYNDHSDFKLFSQYYCIFDQINAALVQIRDFQKPKNH